MHNFKKILPRLVLIIVFIFLLEKAARFCYESYDKYSIYANREYKEELGKITTLFCGTSRTYSGYNPAVYDELTAENSFNMGTGAQAIKDTYYIIKDALRLNPVKKIFLEVSLPTMQDTGNDSSTLGSSDRVYSLTGKLDMAFHSGKNSLQVRELFYSTRVKDYFDLDTIRKNVSYKLSSESDTAPYMGKNEGSYIYKGFINNSRVFSGNRTTTENKSRQTWNRSSVSEKCEQYLKDIIALCRSKEVELILVSPPLPDALLQYAGDMEDMNAFYTELAEQYDLKFYDMNFYKEKDSTFPTESFRDTNHLNLTGADTFTRLVVQIYESGEEYMEYFQ